MDASEWEDVSPTTGAAAPAPADSGPAGIIPEVGYINRMGRGMADELGSQISAIGQVIRHPINSLTAAAKEALAGLSSPASRSAELVSSLPGVAKGVVRQAATPEGQGALLVQAGEAAIPVGRLGAAAARRGLPILGGATEVSRAYNIKRALRIPTGTGKAAIKAAQDIESMAPEIVLPVTKSPQKLADALTARVALTGEAVNTTEAALPARRIATTSITDRIPPAEGTWRTSPSRTVDVPSGPAEFETVTVPGQREFVPYSPEAAAQRQASVADLERYGPAMTTQEAIGAKRAAQNAAYEKGAYATPEAKGAAAAAEERAIALREALEAMPGPEAAAFTKANRAHHVAETIAAPASIEATRLRGLPLATRSSEMLLGRGFTQNPSVLGAIAGVATGNILDSRLFHTASAAVKRQVIDALQTGMPQKAADILFRASVLESQRRRAAAAELAAQGEGVTTP